MLTLEPRASDDETLESEASIGTADSSENLNVDSEEPTSDFSGTSLYSRQGFEKGVSAVTRWEVPVCRRTCKNSAQSKCPESIQMLLQTGRC